MHKTITLLLLSLLAFSCDVKNVSVKGRVVDAVSGQGAYNMLVTMHQCKSNGDNCDDIVIGQCFTDHDGAFAIDHKTARQSKTKWITVYNTNKKLAEKDNIGVTESNLVIEVTP